MGSVWRRRLRRKVLCEANAKRLIKEWPSVVTIEQARDVLKAVGGKYEHAMWVCQTCAGAQHLFADKLDPVLLAKRMTKRVGWEPKL